MATVPTLKFVSSEVCLRILLHENPVDNADGHTNNVVGHNSYMTQLFETDCYTAVSEYLLNRILKYNPEKFTDRLLKALVPPHIRQLNLEGCENVRLMGLVGTLKKCQHVQKLNLSQLPHLIHADVFTFMGLMKIPLTTLVLDSNNITDKVIHSVLKNAPNLSTLHVSSKNISNNVFLLDEEIQYSKEVSPTKCQEPYTCNLTNISICGCKQLTNKVVEHISSLCGPTLKCIDISNTSCNCIALLYLAGYSLPAIVDIMLTEELISDKSLEPLLEEFKSIRDIYVEEYSDKSDTDENSSIECKNKLHSDESRTDINTEKSKSLDVINDGDDFKPDLDSRLSKECDSVTCRDSDCSISLKSNLPTSESVSLDNVTDNLGSVKCLTKDVNKNIKELFDKCKLKYDALLYEPNILSLDVKGIKFVNEKMDQICLKKFLDVNKSLQKFAMKWNGLTHEYFPSIVCNMADLRDVDLEECFHLQNEGVTSLGQNCQKLQSVNIRGVKFFGDVSLVPFLKNKNLQNLNLAESIQITDKILILMSEQMNESLTSLDLSWCEEITDAGINVICSNCNNLKTLQLGKCQVSDMGLKLLSETCQDLTEITVQNGFAMEEEIISDEGIIAIATNLIHLTIVDISWNLQITNVSVSIVMKNCCELEEAYLRGLKQITIEPFLPIIPDHKDVSNQKGDYSYMRLYRSTVYARNLRILSLEFCDLVDDGWLQKISNICRGSLSIDDYYGQNLLPETT
ncbi:hypothetical protein ACF0H5_012008 [Mactra antiquata]